MDDTELDNIIDNAGIPIMYRPRVEQEIRDYATRREREAQLRTLKRLANKTIPRGDDIHPEYTKGFEEMQGKVKFELKRLAALRQGEQG